MTDKCIRYGVRVPIALDVKSNGVATGFWDGYALSCEHSGDLQCVVNLGMEVLSRTDPDPDIASAAKHLIPEANTMRRVQQLRDAWEEDFAGRHGDGALSDHIYERNQA